MLASYVSHHGISELSVTSIQVGRFATNLQTMLCALSGDLKNRTAYNFKHRERSAMYSFKPISERIQKMHDRIRDRIIEIDDERAKIVTESYKRTENVPWMIRCMCKQNSACGR